MSRASEQAFPVPSGYGYERTYGLTIREHFAAMMLQGLVAGRNNSVETEAEGMWAASAVSIADALIEELAKVRP